MTQSMNHTKNPCKVNFNNSSKKSYKIALNIKKLSKVILFLLTRNLITKINRKPNVQSKLE